MFSKKGSGWEYSLYKYIKDILAYSLTVLFSIIRIMRWMLLFQISSRQPPLLLHVLTAVMMSLLFCCHGADTEMYSRKALRSGFAYFRSLWHPVLLESVFIQTSPGRGWCWASMAVVRLVSHSPSKANSFPISSACDRCNCVIDLGSRF